MKFSNPVVGLIKFYQKFISPLLPPSCIYYPSCSSYMLQAINRHGTAKGSLMGLVRIGRCHPFSEGGSDPVPDTFSLKRNERPLTEEELFDWHNHNHF